MKNFYDTCALLNLGEKAFAKPFFISLETLRELERIKTSKSKDEDIKHAARKVTRLLYENPQTYTVYHGDRVEREKVLGEHPNADSIICFDASRIEEPVLFVTDDLACSAIARGCFGLDVSASHSEDDVYTGYIQFAGTSDEINEFMISLDHSKLYPNEYLILTDTEQGITTEMRYDGEKFVELHLPKSSYIKGKNSFQRCALDLLANKNIDIVAILGIYGSGKSYLTTKMALFNVLERGQQSKILGVREPRGEGASVGYLKGTLEDKTRDFFLPIQQQLDGGEFELQALQARGVLDTNIPYYMKGTTYENTVMLVDEAEDLTEAQLRLVGTRLGQNSRIFLSGDYGQSLINKTASNPLVKMCNSLKGLDNFGCIYLDEDVRSNASKVFTNLFK